MSVQSFGDKLAEKVRQKESPLVVGLDPRWDHLPAELRKDDHADWAARAEAYFEFCRDVIDVISPFAPAVKPQAAFFEQLGPEGMHALHRTICHAQAKGLLVILDGKRGDISSTGQAYAQGYLTPRDAGGAWGADALTVNPYLGQDSLEPFVEVAEAFGGGIFVLVKTSNPGGGLFQDLLANERPLYAHVAHLVEQMSAQFATGSGYGAVGAVVGATYPAQLQELRRAMPHAWILVPGYGSQGGTANDVAAAFDSLGLGALVNSSRGIIFAYEQPAFREAHAGRPWQQAVETAAQKAAEELRYATRASL